jgi:hypothetical protein
MNIKDKPEGLINHMESNLGRISSGWKHIVESTQESFQVVRFEDKPMAGAVTFSTLGLSKYIFTQESGNNIRQELLFCCYERFSGWSIQEILIIVSEDLLFNKKALMRGQVLGPAGPLFQHSTLEALYCASPVYYPDSLHQYSGSNPITFFVWLIPISVGEAEKINQNGWCYFEDLLVKLDPDLLDVQRTSVIA